MTVFETAVYDLKGIACIESGFAVETETLSIDVISELSLNQTQTVFRI